MPGGYACQFCEGQHPVTVLITWLTNGASVMVCEEDLAPALINILAVDLGVDPTRFYDGVRKLVDREAKKQATDAGKGTPDTDPDGAAAGTGELTPGPGADREALLASLPGDVADAVLVDDDA
jgi:hypothetical protein